MIVKYNLFTILWASVILVLTLVTGRTDANMDVLMLDKFVHAFMFGFLSLLLIVGLKKQSDYPLLRIYAEVVAIIVSAIYGVMIEVIQLVIPGRFFEWQDMLANTLGAIVGYLLFLLIYKLG